MTERKRTENSAFADIDGARIFHRTSGQGTACLMMHGGLGHDHTVLRMHDVLADRLRLVYYDHRGNGRSSREGLEGIDHVRWNDDAAGLLDHLEEPSAIIYGHSYGAMLALGFAVHHPGRVRALILSNVSPRFDYGADVIARVAAAPPAISSAFAHFAGVLPTTDDQLRDGWLSLLPMYLHRHLDAAREAFAEVQYSAAGYVAGAACLSSFDVLDRLSEIRVPTLIVVGSHDFITPPSEARRTAAGIPGAEVIELAESGHYPFLEQPAEYLAELRSWLTRHALLS